MIRNNHDIAAGMTKLRGLKRCCVVAARRPGAVLGRRVAARLTVGGKNRNVCALSQVIKISFRSHKSMVIWGIVPYTHAGKADIEVETPDEARRLCRRIQPHPSRNHER